jgi:DNA-binding CsgD family transcriptional regulator
MTRGAATKSVIFEDEEYVLAGRVDVSGMSFWIERPRGHLWLHVSEVVDFARYGVDPHREIVASTWDDPSEILKDLAQKSGWFEFTARLVSGPGHQTNEVWRLTPECLNLLRPSQVGNVLDSIFRQDDEPVKKAHTELTMAQMVSRTMERIKPLGFAALAVIRPDPVRDPGVVVRSLAAVSADPLRKHASVLEMGPGENERDAFQINLALHRSEWSGALSGSGYRTAQILRIAPSDARHFEFLALSLSGAMSDAAGHAFVYDVMSTWPDWRRVVQREICPLTAREREALKAAAAGLTGAEASGMLGCVERTFRLHIENAKKKLSASTVAEAAFKAHLLCAF